VVVQSKVGGEFELMEFDITFLPGEVLDLSLLVNEKELLASKELKRALEKGCLVPADSKVIPGNFRAATAGITPTTLEDPVRRAIFEDKSLSVEASSYWQYVMLDLDIRRAIVTKTRDTKLLRDIIENEMSQQIVATARGRLTRLEQVAEGG
jgi:hypothetical protein